MALIHEKIAKCLAECGAVAKDSFNPMQKYKYRGIDAVINALNPAFAKNGVFCAPKVIDIRREDRESKNGGGLIYSVATVQYTFYAEDGSAVEVVVAGEGMDSGDKSLNKAMSAAFKYACFQLFCIATEEMKDSEIDSPQVAPVISDSQKRTLYAVITESVQGGKEEKRAAYVDFLKSKGFKNDNITVQQYTAIIAELGKAKA